jgi:D-serine deaminase-like pyridoxal phosphate-dependent protein
VKRADVIREEELPTPAIVIDVERVRRNVYRLADHAKARGIGIRPHTKTHKSIDLARMQLEAGACGLTVAKVGEAKAMSQAGDDILMAYPAVDPLRCRGLAELAAAGKTVRVGVDSAAAIDALASCAASAGTEIGILVDVDVGLHRTGVQTPEEALTLSQQVERLSGVRLDGIMFYPGHVKDESPESLRQLDEVEAKISQTIALWLKHGLGAGIVSGGSTPSAYQSHRMPSMTEARPGTYVFHDMNGVRGGYASFDDVAATIRATVVSTAVPGQFVLDCGSKTLTSDRCGPAPDSGHGHVLEFPDARITKLTEEHAQVDARESDRRPKVGDRVTVIPNHICPCVNLQDFVWWKEGDKLRRVTVDARGCVF